MKAAKVTVEMVSRAAGLCVRAKEVFECWVEASVTGDVNDFARAHRCLADALRERVERLVVIAPLLSWRERHFNALVLRPSYREYESVKQGWRGPKPASLPLHFPVEVDAGVGPYATGRHLVLFFESAMPGGDLVPTEDHVGFELLPTWRERVEQAVPWLMTIAVPQLHEMLEQMAGSESRTGTAILESILAHETGHTCGQWVIYPHRPMFEEEAVRRVTEQDLGTFQVICGALAEVSADEANVASLSDEAVVLVFAYHLMNLLHCWRLSPATKTEWEPLRSDVDCLSGALIWTSTLYAVGSESRCLTIDVLRNGLANVGAVVRRIIADIRSGSIKSAFELTRLSLPPLVGALLDTGPHPIGRSYESRLPLQKYLSPLLYDCISEITY